MKVKKLIYLMLCAGSLSASTYYIKIEDNLSKSFNRDFDWQISNSVFTNWVDIELPFNHSQYFPEISNQSTDFQQSRNYDQKQERYEQQREEDASKGVFKNIGSPIRHEQTITKLETRTINVSILTDWTDVGSVTNCTDWTPLTSTVANGEEFTQSRDCDQERTRTLEYYSDSNLEHSNTETNFFTVTENQQNFGTQDLRWVLINSQEYLYHHFIKYHEDPYSETKYKRTGAYDWNDSSSPLYNLNSSNTVWYEGKQVTIKVGSCSPQNQTIQIRTPQDRVDVMYDVISGPYGSGYRDTKVYNVYETWQCQEVSKYFN